MRTLPKTPPLPSPKGIRVNGIARGAIKTAALATVVTPGTVLASQTTLPKPRARAQQAGSAANSDRLRRRRELD